jgi:hypothetical protein
MNRLHLSVAAAALILGLAACSGASTTSGQPASHTPAPGATSAPAASSAPAQPAGTQVITYAPWTASGGLASGISATSTQSGSCFASSSATNAPDAFRCLVGNLLYDPCFADASSGSGEVLCPDSENPDSVILIKLTSALPAPNSTPASLVPWLLVLANGQHCNTNTGTVGTLGGRLAYYDCADGNAYGLPDQSSATWTITYAASGATASAMTQVAVTTAYE